MMFRHQILGLLIQYNSEDGVESEFVHRMLPLATYEEICVELREAKSLGLLSTSGSRHWVTLDGREEYDAACRSPMYQLDDRAWREEAQTGITAGGKRSAITSAVGQTGQRPREAKQYDVVAQIERVRALARRLEIDTRELVHLLARGEVRRCTRCGQTSRHQSRGDGHGYRSHCRKCVNEAQKNRQDRKGSK